MSAGDHLLISPKAGAGLFLFASLKRSSIFFITSLSPRKYQTSLVLGFLLNPDEIEEISSILEDTGLNIPGPALENLAKDPKAFKVFVAQFTQLYSLIAKGENPFLNIYENDANIEEYVIKNRKAINKYLTTNLELQNMYINLINDLYFLNNILFLNFLLIYMILFLFHFFLYLLIYLNHYH